MNQSDVKNLENAYRKVLKEDLGLGGQAIQATGLGSGMQGVVTVSDGSHSLPFSDKTPLDNEDGNDMAVSQVKGVIDDAMQILKDLHNSDEIEDWVLSKIATVEDRINSVRKYLEYNKDK